ncbi:hypothetical protein N7539_001326 [Penicillium diatomitis]|uniref:Uncharacterized protein n=1 Tax=Penicillium diatomitis TaxID=2819901 RepID=A0A9X0BZZ4_9EURO|nr:uncharacterized protein N7539_001326 [Penicillium diatomitis]KAJ5492580.1 hypothetical protein N7539_001326 [Penicillium diatomitis]
MGKGPLERKLQFEKNNQNLTKLPKYAKVEKRPIPHPPVASPYAGAAVPKIVYVSSNTPFMSAVKRVQKLLRQAEKRATSKIGLDDGRKSEQQKLAELAKVTEKREEVFVKATGRAIEKALNVGKWFEEKEAEYIVRTKTGSVLVVDDIVEDEEKKERELRREQQQHRETEMKSQNAEQPASLDQGAGRPEESGGEAKSSLKPAKKRKGKRSASAISEDAELPESRTRWIKMVEVAVSLK